MPRYRFSYESTAFYEQVIEAATPEEAARIAHEDDPANWKCVYEDHGTTHDRFEELADLWWDEPVEAFEAKMENYKVKSVIKLEPPQEPREVQTCLSFDSPQPPSATT